MAAVLTAEVLQDDVAVSLARVIAAANRCAREAGINVQQSLITISQLVEGETRWRINYGPLGYLSRRGGDLVVEVDAADASIKQVLHGQ